MCSAPAFHAQYATEAHSECTLQRVQDYILSGDLWIPQNVIFILITEFVEGTLFQQGFQPLFMCKQKYINFLSSLQPVTCRMHAEIYRLTTDIKAVGACPSKRFDKKHLLVRLLKPETSCGLISILVSSHSHHSWQVMHHMSPASILKQSGCLWLPTLASFL